GAVSPLERARELVRRFAWTGTINASAILGAAGAAEATQESVSEAFERWWQLRQFPAADPVALTLEGGRLQPYPLRIGDYPAEPAPSLLAAMDVVASRWGPRVGEGNREGLLGAARLRWEAAQRRLERLEAEVGR